MSTPHGPKAFAEKRTAKAQEMSREDKRWQAEMNLKVRTMQALESIAESLHVANREAIMAFRDAREKEAEELAQAEAAAKADADLMAQPPEIPAQP